MPAVLESERELEKPKIRLDQQLDVVTDEILKELYGCNQPDGEPPAIYVRGGFLSRLAFDEEDRPRIELMNEHIALSHIVRAADFFKLNSKGVLKDAHPSFTNAKQVLVQGYWNFPPLRGITEIPVIRSDGTILDANGYDSASRLLYLPQAGLLIPAIPEHPTQEQAKEAAAFAFDFISEFPYATDVDRANACALMLTVVTRSLCSLVPLCLLNAHKAGTGKTLLFKVIAYLLTGRPVGTTPLPTSEEQMSKVLTGLLLTGTSITFCFDNCDSMVRSGILSSFLTTPVWKERLLGSNAMPELEQRTIPVITGNNIMIGGDLPRRCYRITIDAGMSAPWTRDTFKYHPLLDEIAKRRGEIIANLLTMVRAWCVAGQPPPQQKVAFQDDFSEWARVTSGILSFVGIDGFLGNLTEMYADADVEGREWTAFLEHWYFLTQKAHTVSDFVNEFLVLRHDLAPLLPEPLNAQFQNRDKDKSFAQKFSRTLAKKNHMPYGLQNLRIIKGEDSHTHAATYRVDVRNPEDKVAGLAGAAVANKPYINLNNVEQACQTANSKNSCSSNLAPQVPQAPQPASNGHDHMSSPEDIKAHWARIAEEAHIEEARRQAYSDDDIDLSLDVEDLERAGYKIKL